MEGIKEGRKERSMYACSCMCYCKTKHATVGLLGLLCLVLTLQTGWSASQLVIHSSLKFFFDVQCLQIQTVRLTEHFHFPMKVGQHYYSLSSTQSLSYLRMRAFGALNGV